MCRLYILHVHTSRSRDCWLNQNYTAHAAQNKENNEKLSKTESFFVFFLVCVNKTVPGGFQGCVARPDQLRPRGQSDVATGSPASGSSPA